MRSCCWGYGAEREWESNRASLRQNARCLVFASLSLDPGIPSRIPSNAEENIIYQSNIPVYANLVLMSLIFMRNCLTSVTYSALFPYLPGAVTDYSMNYAIAALNLASGAEVDPRGKTQLK